MLEPLSPAVLKKVKSKRKLKLVRWLKNKLIKLTHGLVILKKNLIAFENNVRDKFTEVVEGKDDTQGIHGQLDALGFAFSHKGKENLPILNIALTGGYGTGKSSVVETFKAQNRDKSFIHLAFTHFQPHTEPTEDGKAGGSRERLLEAKILNQLVHQVPARRIPRTRFPIKRKLSNGKKTIAAFASIFIMSASIIVIADWEKWNKKAEILSEIHPRLFIVASAILALAAICTLAWLLASVWRDGIKLNKAKLAGAGQEIELGKKARDDDDSMPFFDRYLTEVLYVLEQVDADAIVIEDLDRGKDNQIFTQLREICRLANHPSKGRRKPLRFIYLLKDEEFEPEDRTKFFDLIIPVTPVMHSQEERKARLDRLLEKAECSEGDKVISLYKPTDKHMQDLIEHTAYYIRDFRLLKNIVNEAQMQVKLLAILDDSPLKKEEKPPEPAPLAKEEAPDVPKDAATVAAERAEPEEADEETPENSAPEAPELPDAKCALIALMIYKNLFSDDYWKFLQGYGEVYGWLFEEKRDDILKPDNYFRETQPKRDETGQYKKEQHRKLIKYFLEHEFIRATSKMLEKIILDIKMSVEAASAPEEKLTAFGEGAKQLEGKNLVNVSEQFEMSFGAYTWRVLAVKNNRALLLSRDILERRPYNTEFTGVTWETCTLRQYLNGEFYESFTQEEKARIEERENDNPKNQWYGTEGGNNTKDKVFLLSIEEVVKYFGDSGDLAARKGWYWEKGKDELKDEKGYYINDQYNGRRVAKFNGSGSWWWLRSPGINQNYAALVDDDGIVNLIGRFVTRGAGGVRPALWLNL